MSGLSPNRIVNVTVDLTPKAVASRNFGATLILGSSNVIDVAERERDYTGLDGIAQDFGTSAPEYLAAVIYFSQKPQPGFCKIGRWAKTAAAGRLNGGTLATADETLANFTAITTGSTSITVDSTPHALAALDFSGALNLNGVAAILDTALTTATVVWNSTLNRFEITSATTGASSTVAFGVATGSGVDITHLLKLAAVDGAHAVAGIAAETLPACVARHADLSTAWYGLIVADGSVSADDHMAVAAFIEASTIDRAYGATLGASSTVLTASDSTDLASRVKAAGLERTYTVYSSSNPYAAATILGRLASVNFAASNSAITIMFKDAPGLAAEILTETQANTLAAKNCNVFAVYTNDAAILQNGVMGNGYYIDDVFNTDAMKSTVQTDLFNALVTAATKIPQTDKGTHVLATVAEATCARFVANGVLAPGIWNSDPIGPINTGDQLPKGYQVYVDSVDNQSQADREARKSPPIQILAKLAGAIQSVDCLISVNR